MKNRTSRIVKKVIGQVHLWLGLIAGIVVVLSMLGAAVFVWEEELNNWYYHNYIFVEQIGEERLPPSELFQAVENAFPGVEFTSISLENDPQKSCLFVRFKRSEDPGFSWWSTIEYYEKIYVDPYDGNVLGVVDMRYDWIQLTRRLHQNLLLNPKFGEMIVGIAALIMIVLAISGLYLWWPKNKRMLMARFNIKWNAKWRRVNWDIHSVGGFYTNLLLIFFAATGLVWTFSWWTDGIYYMLGNDPEEVFVIPEAPAFSHFNPNQTVDIAFSDAISRREGWTHASLSIPAKDKEAGFISVFLSFEGLRSGWNTSDTYTYHPETGAIYWEKTHEHKLLGEKWRNSNYKMHVGSIYGWPTKIIAFVSALFFACLPVTGFLIWWGRKKKKKRSVRSTRKRVTAKAFSDKTNIDEMKDNSDQQVKEKELMS